MAVSTDTHRPVLPLLCFLLISSLQSTTGQLSWQNTQAVFTIPEGTDNGYVITTNELRGGDGLQVVSENPSVYVNVTNSGNKFVAFSVILNTTLDYDYGVQQMQCSIRGTSTDGQSKQLTLNIFVEDVNDMTPVLQNQPYTVVVPEDTSQNTTVYTKIYALDKDTRDSLSYNLTTTGDDVFAISETGSLILKGALDFETVRFYHYIVTVMDKVGHNSSADVFITVEDVQDTQPYFTGEPFQTKIYEDEKPGATLLTIRAADGDRGVSNDITLKIISGTCTSLSEIHPTSGELKLKNVADRDTGEVYQNNGICTFEVQATEGKKYPQVKGNDTAVTSVTVTILDVNDNGPLFSSTSYHVTVDENTQEGVPININTPITVSDADQGINAKIEVHVIGLEDYFEVTPSQIQSSGDILIRVKNSTILDYETVQTLTLELEARDASVPGNSSKATVTIYINNINDNSPVFSNSTFYATVPENSPSSTYVTTITATDADKHDGIHHYETVQYSLQGSNSSFKINPFTGEVTVDLGQLDRETKSVYYLTVIAEDGGHIKTNALLEISISDENDEQPLFITNDYQTSLKEGAWTFNQPITVRATDKDDPNSPNSHVLYSIISTLPPGLEESFSLDNVTGTLTVNKSLKFENIKFSPGEIGNITLIVEAKDEGSPAKFSRVSVAVTLQDVNNKNPECGQPLYMTEIYENSTKSSAVSTVTASDADGMAPNNLFMFNIDQDSAGKFVINSSTGLLSLRDMLDREDKSHYDITVTVTDFGVPALSGSCQVSVDVLDNNDVPPEFVQKTRRATHQENTLGLSVNMTADDKDLDNKLVYKIIWEQSIALDPEGQNVNISILKNWTTIESDTGRVFNTEKMDREAIESFTLAIQVADMNSETGPQVDNATLTVQVLDENDKKPEFSQSLYSGTIQENMPDGSEVSLLDLLIVTDEDKSVNSEFKLSITSLGNVFSVEPAEGKGQGQFSLIVRNTSVLDYEQHQVLLCEIVATETKTTKKFSNTATVAISILNTNDNMPDFENAPYSATVLENELNGTFVTTIKANDADKDPYGTVTYTFLNNPQGFTINETSGDVFTDVTLNREQQEIYTLSVKATDIGNFASTTQLTITVTDVNDNHPQFLKNRISATIAENEHYFSPPLLAEATDADAAGNNSQIKYTIQSSIPANLKANFTIDPDNSEIVLLSPLDYDILNPTLMGVIYLTVKAEDQGVPQLSNTTSVTINVKDINDLSPQFTMPTSIVHVPENVTTGKTVFNVTAIDGDISTNNHELSYLIDTLSGSIFNINANSGEITLRTNLDFEKVQAYNITVTALDHGSPVQTSTAIINVKVMDVNDQNPQFSQKQMSTSVDENKNFQYLCTANDVDSSNKLEYSIQWDKSSGQDIHGAPVSTSELQKWFDIDPKTGSMKSVQLLDREQVSMFVLQVGVEDTAAEDNKHQTDTATLTVTVNDVNDQPPVFSLGQYNASIRENMPDRSDIKFEDSQTLEIYDADDKESNNHFAVFLLTHNTTFSISPSSANAKQTFTISVLNSSMLDYEINKNFTLEVLAIDPSNPSMNSSATILVNIINENDNIPEFIGGPYKASFLENSATFTAVITVNATDKDDGIYGEVTYSLEDTSQTFDINNVSGEVYLLTDGTDRENVSEYTVKLIATDKGGFRATTQLIIEVNDINDQPPVFTENSYSLTFNEGITVLLPEYFVMATDKDEPNTVNSQIKYTLLDNDESPQSNFSIDPHSGKLTLNSLLDYESLNGTFILKVQAEDQGVSPNLANVSVKVTVQDVNDNHPVFNPESYTADIYENSTYGSPVATVSATDNDLSSTYNKVSYSLDTLSLKTFSIHPNGTITVKDKLDREQTPDYTIIVTAMDNGQPALTSTASVTVTVLDVNDSPPTFSWDSWSVTRTENTNVLIAQNNATDPDLGFNLHYSILWSESTGMNGNGVFISGNPLKAFVTINNTTGEVYPVNVLDREQLQRLQLTLVVEDKNNVPNSKNNDTAILTVIIEDEDDNAPTFNGNDFTATIQENMPPGSEIKMINVSALIITDADEERYNHFDVFLLTHNTTFIINPSSANAKQTFIISVLDSSLLDYEINKNFTLEVLAIDPNTPTMNSSATILVIIINENDNIPEFIGGPYKAAILENSAVSTAVITVNATDKDDGIYGEVTYSLEDTSQTFDINNVSGEVYFVTGVIDRENVSEYTVKLIATDKGGFRATTQLIIEVNDDNDESPVFTGKNYSLTFDEGITILLPEFFVTAKDKDEPNTVNSQIKYSLLDNTMSPQSNFSIDPDTGKLTLNSALDYESLNGTFILKVQAEDQGASPNLANVSVEVTVQDVNDNHPVFNPESYTAGIYENSTYGTYVATVSATDNDLSSSNNNVSYSLDTLSLKTFSIHQNGTITVKDKLDREQTPDYTIIVTAMDNGKPVLASTASVSVTVLDVNDSPPTFSWDTWSVNKKENTTDVIAQNNATDPDLHPNLYYSILWSESTGMDGDGRFIPGDSLKTLVTINNTTGEVYPVNVLDREKLQRLQLTLVVEDKNNVPNSKNNDTAILTVIIEDINDNAPTFNGNNFVATIQENMPPGSEIKMINVSALIITDADEGDNSMYNITLEDSSVFTISPSQGDGSTTCTITVANSSLLDFEQHQNFTIKVLAIEHKTSRTESAVITVSLINVNDNFPKFNQSSYEAFVPENAPVGDLITTLEASDADFGDFGLVQYFIDGLQTWFYIDNTGRVILNTTEIDREKKDSYTITVKARDTGGFEGSTQLTIRVTDYNDETPDFETPSYSAEIKENDTVFKVPLFVKATDDDEPGTENSQISYSITDLSAELMPSQLKINNITGEITLSAYAPDYENLIKVKQDRVLQLQVTAIDQGSPPLNSSVFVNVTVTDINDETPTFGQPSYSGSVPENATAGEAIVTVTATDSDGTSPNNESYYVILSGSRDKLQINSTTGLISVGIGAKLDRETTDKNGFDLTVLAIDKGSPPLTGTTTVSIQVMDVNDVPPNISPVSGVFTVYENASTGEEIVRFNATDEDEIHNLEFSLLFAESRAYDEKDREANATLIKEWLDIHPVHGIVTVKSKIDREIVEQIILKVVVKDTNAITLGQEATATVTLSLLDVNDNPPEISSEGGVLHLNVSEGTKVNTEVNTLTATDADKRQTVTFNLANTDSFDITKSGTLKLTKSLDRENNTILNFHVIATDSGIPPLSSNITVIVNVLDINDNDPVFDSKQTTFYVLEHSDNTTLVASITANDKDAGDNANVTFEFKDFPPFTIDSITGQIYVSGELDRETTPIYTLTVIAMDNPLLESRRRASMAITIYIEDINDNDPVFQSSNYEGIIPETALLGSPVTITPSSISATDKDLGNNSMITFSFIDSGLDFFSIDASNGEVFVNKNVTGKPGTQSYVVNASDHGDPVRWTEVNLTVTILDTNNNEPVFVNLTQTFQIPECALGDKSVYTFNAIDADADKETNGKVQYYLDTGAGIGNNISQYFDLDQDSGVLTTKHTASSGTLFDKETLSELMMQVIAKDKGIPPNSVSSSPILIKITDINDNPPEFNSGINTDFTVQEERSHVRVGNVKAFDKDDSSQLEYELADGDAPWKDYFYVMTDPNDGGVIYVNKSLDRERVSQIKLKVRANDISSAGDHQLCDKSLSFADSHSVPLDVTVFVDDINDNPPVFSEKSLSVGFLSSTKFGVKIISLQGHVRDNDTAANSVHSFHQVGDMQPDSDISRTWTHDVKPDPIRIDLNGTISTNYKFSEDAYGFFRLQILVNDSAGNDTLDLKIYVVGESQVIHVTLWYTEDELRTFQADLTRELGHIGYQFVPDNILPAYADDGSIDNSKSVLVTHAVDSEGNIVSGKTVVSALDSSPLAADIRNRFKMFKTESGEEAGKHEADTSAETIKFILIGIIGVVIITFAVTLALLIHTIRRFKRKLTAATLDVNAISPAKPDIFPGLDNENIKSANPMFMRDDLIFEDSKFVDELEYFHNKNSDTLSNTSDNSLDHNAISSERARTTVDEQEVTLDVYDTEDTGPGLSNLYSYLEIRHSDTEQHDEGSPHHENRQGSGHVDSDEDIDEVVDMNFSQFDSTDI